MQTPAINPNIPKINVNPAILNTSAKQANPTEPKLPQAAVPPQGTQARPPIDNIATNPSNHKPTGSIAISSAMEMTAATVASNEEAKKEEKLKNIKETAKESVDNEAELIDDMRNAINEKTLEVSKKVNKSAFKYAYKNKNWFNQETAKEAEKFFTKKVPEVLSRELSKILNDTLGLNDDNKS